MNEDEAEKAGKLNKIRQATKQAKSAIGQAKVVLSFGKKISKHWVIILVAVLFDIFALIPFISVLFNLTFAIILFLYFSSKNKKKESANLLGIVLPQVLGNVLDWILSIIPVNIGTVLVRIILSDDTAEGQKKVPQEETI